MRWVKNESIRAADNFSLDYTDKDKPQHTIMVPYGTQLAEVPKGFKVEYVKDDAQ